jgi:hypothetical protein
MAHSCYRRSGTGMKPPHSMQILAYNNRKQYKVHVRACNPGILVNHKGLIGCRTLRRSYRQDGTAAACRHGLVHGVLGGCREGGICDDPMEISQACMQLPATKPLELLVVYNPLEYNEFECNHTCNSSYDNEREQPRSNDSFPRQHFHSAGCLMARLLL